MKIFTSKKSKTAKRILLVAMLLSLTLGIFSGCGEAKKYDFSAAAPIVESVVGYGIESVEAGEIQAVADQPTTYWSPQGDQVVDNSDDSWYYADPTSNSFTISTPAQLASLAVLMKNVEDSFYGVTITLKQDIDLSEHKWITIGTNSYKFQGTFNGDGHKISGLCTSNVPENENYVHLGLFADVGVYGEVINTITEGSYDIVGDFQNLVIGGIVGSNAGKVFNCSSTVRISCKNASNALCVGGIAGTNGGEISNCYSEVDIFAISDTAKINAGGIVGAFSGGNSTVCNSYSNGKIIGKGTSSVEADYVKIGGIIGANGISTSNCYSTTVCSYTNDVDINLKWNVGACVGYSKMAVIENCYVFGNGDTKICGNGVWDIKNSATFDVSGKLTLANVESDSNKLAGEFLLPALNAYVKTTNETNGNEDLKAWCIATTNVGGVDVATASFEGAIVPPAPTSSSSSPVFQLDTHAPTIAIDGEIATIYDANLAYISIDGVEVEISGNTVEIDLAKYGNGNHEIVAKDKYRREATETVVVSSVKEEEVPSGTETPQATQAPTVSPETRESSNGYIIWIVAALVAIGVVFFAIYKKKKN